MGGWRRRAKFARAAIALGALSLVLAACKAGTWSTATAPAPVRAIHAALLPTGKILLVAGSGGDPSQFAAGTFRSTVWDPATNAFTPVTTPSDMFCSGHAFLPDGRLLVAGGTADYQHPELGQNYAGSKLAYTFDPATQQYTRTSDLASGHWYPTLVTLGDGRVLATAGLDENRALQSRFQVFNPTTATWTAQQNTSMFFPTYPALHLLTDGRLFYSGVSTFGVGNVPAGIWNPTSNTFTTVSGLTDPDRRDMGASVLLPPAQDQRVMVLGGGQHNDTSVAATASTAIIDLKQPSPSFVAGPPMSAGKQYVSAVILPDRSVLQTNGTSRSYLANAQSDFKYVYSSQLYHPDTGKWEDAADAKVGRSYHSEALLLPDGRVATFGSSASNQGDPFEMRVEIYSPSYTTKTRPVLTVAPASRWVNRGGTLPITSPTALKSLALVRPSSATHSLDPDQRLVDLPFTQTGSTVSASINANGNLVPPGWYMLFGVDQQNVPSIATWVHVT